MADGFAHSLLLQTPLPANSSVLTSAGAIPCSSSGSGTGVLTSQRVTQNQQVGTPIFPNLGTPEVLPAGAFIQFMTLRETSNTAGVTISIGTTPGGTDVRPRTGAPLG